MIETSPDPLSAGVAASEAVRDALQKRQRARFWLRGLLWALLTVGLAFTLRLLEWPCWQNPEYRLGSEWLLATNDAYHWVAGAEGIGLAVGHPMAEMLQGMASLLGTYPAAVAFWFPMILSTLVALIVFVWVWALGSMEAGMAAGLITTIAPGFLARTLLGYYDTDLVTLFFPLLMTLAPACWAMRYMLRRRCASAIRCASAGCCCSPSPASSPGGRRSGIPSSPISSATMWGCWPS